MNAAFVRSKLQRFKALQEPLSVERRIQTVAGALLRQDRLRLMVRDVALPRCRAALLSPRQGAGAGAVLYLHGGGCLLAELFQHLTFRTPLFTWSLYAATVFGLFGGFLLLAGIIRPLREHLKRKFFL